MSSTRTTPSPFLFLQQTFTIGFSFLRGGWGRKSFPTQHAWFPYPLVTARPKKCRVFAIGKEGIWQNV